MSQLQSTGQSVSVCLLSSGLSTELPPVQSHVRLSTGPGPAEPEVPAAFPQLERLQSSQSHRSSFYGVLLSSGALCLPGEKNTKTHVDFTKPGPRVDTD